MLDFRIETFLTVCQCMNYTRASEELNITQPAVSQHIRYLEKYYQTKLFRYEGKKMKLTHSGELLRKTAVSMQQEMLRLQRKIQGQDECLKNLHLGASPAIDEGVMAGVLEKCLQKYPDTKVSMEVNETEKLLERINLGEVDFALTEAGMRAEEYECFPFSKQKLIAVCSENYRTSHMLNNLESIESLKKERILLGESGSELRRNLERYLYSEKLSLEEFQQVMEIGNLHTVIELVKAGHGITFLYEHTAHRLIENGVLIELKINGFHAEQVFTFLWRKGSIYTEMYREMSEELASIS